MKISELSDKQFSLLPKIINGGIAGIIGVVVVFPLDLVKTRLQNQHTGPSGEKMYKNMMDCLYKTYKAEGYFGMYRGSAVNILLVTPEKAIKLTANDFFRYHFGGKTGTLTMGGQMAAGGLAGMCQTLITTPMELLKIEQQDAGRIQAHAKESGKTHAKMSAMEQTMDLLKTKGIRGLYRGLTATASRDVIFSLIYFPLFATLNNLGPKRHDDTGEAVFWCSFLAGCTSGALGALAVNPLDVVKTRVQAITQTEGARSYNGIIDTYIKTYQHDGILGFYKGGACRMMVLAPLFGVVQTVYYIGVAEFLLRHLPGAK